MCSTPLDAADRAHAAFSAARGELLRAVADLASTKAWHGDGAGSLASWMCARWQISPQLARELVREAESLTARPALGAALRAGEISAEQCRAIAVLCDRDGDDEAWLECLPFWSLHELQREARKKIARELERKDGGIYFRMEHTPDERFMRGEFQLHPEDGAVVLRAIDAGVADGTAMCDWDHAAAKALVELARGSCAGQPTVIVSVTDDALSGAGDAAVLDTGGVVGAETARRLACDASIQRVAKDETGRITGIGRTSRTVPPWLRRVVLDRDGGTCAFPGCGRDRYLECHHVVPWSRGGLTDASNLLTTCWTHHELLHEGGWSLRGEPGPRVTWIRPDGTPFEPRVRVTADTS